MTIIFHYLYTALRMKIIINNYSRNNVHQSENQLSTILRINLSIRPPFSELDPSASRGQFRN